MIRDPFYRQIIDRLQGTLDPELFEQCAADLLRAIYPTLVPIRGGTDSGMDGAIADGAGEPFPLVSTTSDDVIGNLTRNLKSYTENKGTRRRVVLATSQQLTPRKIRNLYRRAAELEFTLIAVHSQEAMVNLLYRNPRWCQELLNLTGDPAPLSVVPLTDRPLLSHALIGREADLAWLRDTEGDKLLVGQPGSGKTFLLHKLALEGDGLFVITRDRGEIAEGIRSEQPKVLIVDDAQVNYELFASLKQLRDVVGAQFSIIASCWPGDREMTAQALNLPDSRIRCLEPLTREEIVKVVKAAGILGPDRLIREIVDQAEGRPGLAVTLAHLCLQGGVREVALGDALGRSLLKFFDAVIGLRAREILAAFSVGGDSGMSMDAVANAFGLNLIDVREIVVKLAAGGVIWDIGQQCLSVRPAALREVLVRDVFFTGAMSLPIEPLLAQAPSLPQAASTLIGARAKGGNIRQEWLIGILERARSESVWGEYAWLGHDEASWILQYHPEKATSIAQPALHQAPEIVIPLLLKAAVGDQRQLHSTPGHPLRLIEDWVHAGYPGTGQVFERRKVLAQLARDWVMSGGDAQIGLRALQTALSPKFEHGTTDPGMGLTWTMHFGYPLIDELLAIQSLWPKMAEVVKTIDVADWEPVFQIVEAWAYPGRVNIKISPETYNTMSSFACQMLRDIVTLAESHPGVAHQVSRIAKDLNTDIKIPAAPEFETLYPVEDLENWEESEKQQIFAVRELANLWSKLDPVQIAGQIALIEREAQSTHVNWPRWTPLLCTEIASNIMSPNSWARALIDASISSDLVAPFLQRAAEIKEPGWVELAFACLDQPLLRWATVVLALTLLNPPEDLLTEVLRKLDGYAQTVQILCARNQVPEHLVRRLLHHEDAF